MSANECYDETSYVMIYIEYNIDGYSISSFYYHLSIHETINNKVHGFKLI